MHKEPFPYLREKKKKKTQQYRRTALYCSNPPMMVVLTIKKIENNGKNETKQFPSRRVYYTPGGITSF